MSRRTLLTLSNDLDKYIVDEAKKMGVTKMDYIRFVLMKDKESKLSRRIPNSMYE